jgi:hypothetical protein
MTETAPRRRRRPTPAYALTQARKAGFVVTSATLAPDGSVSLQFGEHEDVNLRNNPWDEVLIDAPHKERAS